jgi:hypothetical protein
LVLDQSRSVGKVQDGAAVVAQFPVFGRRAARLAESVAFADSSGLQAVVAALTAPPGAAARGKRRGLGPGFADVASR